MRPAESARDAAAIWDIATPSWPGPLPGVSMAGFRERATDLVDLGTVPYPAVTVAVDLGDELLVVDDSSGQQQRGSVVAGLAPGSLRARGRNIECLQVRLSPVVAHAVLSESPELGGTVVALDDLWGRDATRTQEQLRAAASWDDRFAIAEAALARRHEAGRAVDPEVAFAWEQTVTSRGRIRVDQLAAELEWSRKRLWSRFRSQIGLTPKRAAQLVRFDHAAHRLPAGHSAARVAAESGYADQSHLHRDVMAFAGVTPTAVAVAPWLAVDDVAWAGRNTHPRRDAAAGARSVALGARRKHFSKTPGSCACDTARLWEMYPHG
jgi:AraC-like DNA-binding protein